MDVAGKLEENNRNNYGTDYFFNEIHIFIFSIHPDEFFDCVTIQFKQIQFNSNRLQHKSN